MSDLNNIPISTLGYTFGNAIGQVYYSTIPGELPTIVKDYKYAPVLFDINLVGDSDILQPFRTFYKTTIYNGTKKFTMQLDSGWGLEEHIVQIVPQTLNISFNNDPSYTISFQVVAERTPAQDNPAGGGLWDLMELYGDEDLENIFDQLAIFTLIDLPQYFGA